MIPEIVESIFAPNQSRALSPALNTGGPQYPYTLDNPNLDLNDYGSWERVLNGDFGTQTIAGVKVNREDLLCYPPVMKALKIFGQGISCSPMHVKFVNMQKPGEDSIDEKHPAEFLVSEAWNDEQTAADGWKQFIQEAGLFTDAFAWIERDYSRASSRHAINDGPVKAIHHMVPLSTERKVAEQSGFYGDPDSGQIYVEAGCSYYATRLADNRVLVFHHNEVLHYRMFRGANLPILRMLKNLVGLAMAANGFQSRFFAQGGQAGGFIQVPAGTTPKSAKNLERELTKRADNNSWFKVHILRDGATFNKLTIDPQTAAMNAIDENVSRRVYEHYNINPTYAGLPGSDSYGAGESARVAHVVDTLGDHMRSIAKQCRLKMLSKKQQRDLGKRRRDFWFDTQELTKPDFATYIKSLLDLRAAEVYNANEVRLKLGEPIRKDEKATEYYNPSTKSNKEEDSDVDSSGSEGVEIAEKEPEKDQKAAKKAQNKAELPKTEPQKEVEDVIPEDQAAIVGFQREAIAQRVGAAIGKLTSYASNRAGKPSFDKLLATDFGECQDLWLGEVSSTARAFSVDEPLILAAGHQLLTSFSGTLKDVIETGQSTPADGLQKHHKASVRKVPDQIDVDRIVDMFFS